jgi:hypothetical protein
MRNAAALAILVLSGAAAGAQTAPDAAPAKSYSTTPDGRGDPGAITCRPPQKLVNSRMMGPEVCKTNAVWAQYAKDGMDVAADGVHDVPSEKFRSLNPRACRSISSSGGGASNAMTTNFSMICD